MVDGHGTINEISKIVNVRLCVQTITDTETMVKQYATTLYIACGKCVR